MLYSTALYGSCIHIKIKIFIKVGTKKGGAELT